MKISMQNMVYKEVGKGANNITVNTPIEQNTSLLLINPSNEFLANKDFLKQLDSVHQGCYVIAILQDVDTLDRPRPYSDEVLPFFGKLRQNFVLIKTKRMLLNRSRSYRHDNDIDHIFTAYLLLRADVTKENNVDRGSHRIAKGLETEYLPPVSGGFPPLESPMNLQHPVKSIRRMPVLLKPLGNASTRNANALKESQRNIKIKDKTYDINPDRNDSDGTVSFKGKVGNGEDGFVITDSDRQDFGEENVKTY